MAMTHIPKPVKPRGIRFSLPSGFMLGRISPGYGDAELIPLAELSRAQAIAPGGGGVVMGDVAGTGFYLPGLFSEAQVFHGPISNYALRFPAASAVSVAFSETAAFDDCVMYLVTDLAAFQATPPDGAIASIEFPAGATTGVVTWLDTTVTVDPGTVLYIVMPDTPDIELSGVTLLFNADI